MSEPVLDVILPFALTNSNDGQGHAWYRTKDARRRFERDLVVLGHRRQPFDFPVCIEVTRVLGKGQRLWDISSVGRGNWKQLEDALVACGWFHDDGPAWISHIGFSQDASNRKVGPAVRIVAHRRP